MGPQHTVDTKAALRLGQPFSRLMLSLCLIWATVSDKNLESTWDPVAGLAPGLSHYTKQ